MPAQKCLAERDAIERIRCMAASRLRGASKPLRLGPVVLLAIALCFCCGCQTTDYPSLTCKLWTTDSLRNFNEPASRPNTQFFDSTQPPDVLVTYDEINENHDRRRRRAFYLQENFDRLVAHRKPHFVDPDKADSLKPLPPVDGTIKLPGPLTNEAASIKMSADERQFRVSGLYGGESTDVDLPTYETASGNVVRVLLTPAAVVGDTAVAAVVLSFFAFVVLAHSNYCP